MAKFQPAAFTRGVRSVRAESNANAIFASLQAAFEEFKSTHAEEQKGINAKFADVVTTEKLDRVNATIGETGEDSWQDFLPDERPSPELSVTGLRDAASRSRWLAEALSDLSPRERVIIERRRLVEEGATLEELGRELGVSKERIRQLESRAMNKLRVSMMRNVSHYDELFVEE